MRILFRSLTLIGLLFSLFALAAPIVVMIAKGNVSKWRGYFDQGLESIPETIWGEAFGYGNYPEWLTIVYWVFLIVAVVAAWKPMRR